MALCKIHGWREIKRNKIATEGIFFSCENYPFVKWNPRFMYNTEALRL